MSSINEVFVRLDEAVEAVGAVNWDALEVADLFACLDRLETARRRVTACAFDGAAAVDRREKELGGRSRQILADVLRISPAAAKRRVQGSAQLAPRTTLTGQQLPPELAATAKAWHSGTLDGRHLSVIQKFLRELPDHLAAADVDNAEAFLAEQAALLRPDQLEKVAAQLALRLNPDGNFSDADRARKRGFSWSGMQGPDGMSVARLVATPELRALLEAWAAKFAAPGMCNPDDESPTVAGDPSQDVADRDARSHAQRQHDALVALVRGQLGDPRLGEHRGLPVTVVVSTTLEQLHTGAGVAVTAGGTLLPMRDVIRMASHAWHYLAVFDSHTERALYLGRSKRIASADQRIVLHAKDRGCTAPGCDKPGYLSEVHHVDEWAEGGLTNIDKLTFACKGDHALLRHGGWRTRKLIDGATQWLPPPHLPLSGGTNTFHHPERMLPDARDGT
ncbi:MAG: HNH endonuclease signature motif containing protein [Mycobacterium sp.]